MDLPVVILVGGLGSRLKKITEKKPKALIDIEGKPFILRQLNYLKLQGVKHVVICLGFLGDQIKKTVINFSDKNFKIEFSSDGHDLLGTGGAVKKALPLLGNFFFVMYGDSYLPINYSLVEKKFYISKKIALMTIYKNKGRLDSSNVAFNNNIVKYDKKNPEKNMEYIDYGLSVVKSSTFDLYPKEKKFDLGDMYNKLSINGELAGYEVYDRFYEIGSHKGIIETKKYFKKNKVKYIL